MDAPYRHIACCVDESSASRRALEAAIALRAIGPGRLILVHAIDRSLAYQGGFGAWVPDSEDLEVQERAWLEGLAANTEDAEAVTLNGYPPREVCEWAATEGVDLLVGASHRGPVERALLGSFATHLARHATCSVLLVRAPVARPGPITTTAAIADEIAR